MNKEKKRNQISSTRSDHDQDQEPRESFCKIMLPNLSNHLRIPRAFVESFPGIFPSKITLTSSDGAKMQVSIVKLHNKVLFKAGWSDFVKDRSISYGDFLVFDVVSESEYNVTIFKKNGCEESVLNKKAIRMIDIDPGSDCTADEDQNDTEIEMAEKERGAIRGKAQAVKAAEKFVSKHPVFKVRIRRSYLKDYHLHVPAEFVKKYLGKDSKDITLQTASKSWPARLSFQRNNYGGYIWMNNGWHAFAMDNNLHCDDICAFELIKVDQIVLRVTVFRSTC